MENEPTPSPKPVYNLSARVVQLAHIIDRLPPGDYEISLSKQDLSAQAWNVEIVRTEKISVARLPKRTPPE